MGDLGGERSWWIVLRLRAHGQNAGVQAHRCDNLNAVMMQMLDLLKHMLSR